MRIAAAPPGFSRRSRAYPSEEALLNWFLVVALLLLVVIIYDLTQAALFAHMHAMKATSAEPLVEA